MRRISDYLRLLFFTSGLLIGVQVPAFIDQYGKSLEAHMLESAMALREFEKDAAHYFNGDLNRLIAHYQNNKDPVVQDGGNSIQAIYTRNQMLERASKRFNTGTYNAYMHVLLNPLKEIKDEVWRGYTYTIILNPSAIVSGLTAGFAMTLLIDISLLLGQGTLRRLLQRSPVEP